MRNVMLLFFCMIHAAGLFAQKNVFLPIDSILQRNLDKQNVEILLSSDTVCCELLSCSQGDTVQVKNLPEWMGMMVKYTLCQPSMYRTDRKVYCLFDPWVKVSFTKGGTVLTLLLDYSAKKWVLQDADGYELCRYDMTDALELLLILRQLFPDNEYIKVRYNEYIK